MIKNSFLYLLPTYNLISFKILGFKSIILEYLKKYSSLLSSFILFKYLLYYKFTISILFKGLIIISYYNKAIVR